MLHIAVCDEEEYYRKSLKEFVSDHLKEKGILCQVDMFCSGEELLLPGIGVTKYTAVFLDINLPGINGMAAAKKIRNMSRKIFIVFVTASWDYVLEGYKVSATRYLIKNSNCKLFRSSIDECMESIIDEMNYTVVREAFGFREGNREISLERLLYVESDLHKLIFYVMEESLKIYTMYDTLGRIEKRLEGNNFFRLHQSYLVNLKFVSSISRYKAVLANGTELAIPKARYMQVKKAFAAYKEEMEMP